MKKSTLIKLKSKKHGKLTVIGYEPVGRKILCQCDCGNQKLISVGCLQRQRKPIRSCGCITQEINKKRSDDAKSTTLGRVFGCLQPIEVNGDKVKCICVCGSEGWYFLSNLQKNTGPTQSCGCKRQDFFQKTMNEKYGVDHPSLMPDYHDRLARGNIQKWGGPKRHQTEKWLEHLEALKTDHNGCYPGHSPESVKKMKQTIIDKYGSDYFFTSDAFHEMKRQNDWSTSKNELEIKEFIQSLGVHAEKHRLKNPNMELDVFAPGFNIAIEHNGLRWHSELFLPNNYHIRKTRHCAKSGIQLIHVFEHEWNKRSTQIKSRLRSIFKLNKNIIHARKCDIRIIDNSEAKQFVNNHHIDVLVSPICLSIGLYYHEELQAVATFGSHHRQNSGNVVLTRFCCKDNTTISGGLGKISHFASKHFKTDIISWCDRRWSEGDGYLASGWVRDGVIRPEYFYTNFNKICSKQSRKKKSMKTPKHITEHEHALADGFFRVYDCGKIRFVFKYKESH